MSFIAFLTDFVSIRAHIQFFVFVTPQTNDESGSLIGDIAPWMGLQLGMEKPSGTLTPDNNLKKIYYICSGRDLNIFNGLLEIEIEMYTLGGFRFILPDLPIFSDIGVKSMNSILKIYMSKRRDIGKIITNQPIITHSLT
ncbi:hypothetical protein ACJX0J_009518 [Zea mays]